MSQARASRYDDSALPPPAHGPAPPYSSAGPPFSPGPPPPTGADPRAPYSPVSANAAPARHSRRPSVPLTPAPPSADDPPSASSPPRKRLIVGCDGTWLDSDNGLKYNKQQLPSNVTRISRAIKAESSDNVAQIFYYQAGIGTKGGAIDNAVGGAFADGLSSNIREAYSFLAGNWSPGDEIFLIGFSRGAFTVRSVAGMIGNIGLLTKEGLPLLGVIFKDFENRANPNYESAFPNIPYPNKTTPSDPEYTAELQRRKLSRLNIPIKAIGVFDTVGALGIPRVPWLEKLGLQRKSVREYAFYDTSLSDCIENAFQALALDEHRAAFSPTVWEKKRHNKTNLRQVWFPGVHSNVGGGYPDQAIADITLAWMIAQLEPYLDFSSNYLRTQYQSSKAYYQSTGQEPRSWSFGEIYRSMTGLYEFAGRTTRTPGFYYRSDPRTGDPTKKPLRRTNEYIHPSVRARIYLDGPGAMDRGTYECKALTGYKMRLTGSGPSSNQPIAVWESRAQRKGAPRRVLPESPLWDAELKLLRHWPDVEDFILSESGRLSR